MATATKKRPKEKKAAKDKAKPPAEKPAAIDYGETRAAALQGPASARLATHRRRLPQATRQRWGKLAASVVSRPGNVNGSWAGPTTTRDTERTEPRLRTGRDTVSVAMVSRNRTAYGSDAD